MHSRRAALLAALAAAAATGLAPAAASAGIGHPTPAGGHGLAANSRFYVPPPAAGAGQQIGELLESGDVTDASLIAKMELVPSAVWLDGETQTQAADGSAGEHQANLDVARQVHRALIRASLQHAVPMFVAYNIPGRDCSQYSAGGAPTDAAYDAWIDSIRNALGDAQAVLILEPDALANLPGYCGSAYNANFPNITNTTRIEDVAYGVQTLENDPNISLYLDGGHSAWQAVGNIAEVLVAADARQAQGVFFDVSNYQYATNNAFYGTWVSSCIAYATEVSGETQNSALGYAATLTSAANNPSGAFGSCPNQYWNGGPANNWSGTAMSPFGVWSETDSNPALNTIGIDSRYASMLGSTVPTTHFVIDTSRDGQGPNDMQAYAVAPYNQPANVISTLQSGNWCNPPGSGLGTRPTADTSAVANSLDSYLQAGTPLLDAYLWVKTPGQSDGQCDSAAGVRDWQDYTSAGAGGGDTPSIAGWPSSSSSDWTTFDPLWSVQTGTLLTDPAAGAWFPQQALELAQDASPQL
ncbi:MAG TPA: glycoside hydrolase family 6 protein [Solirubrobacteraceae bacterium]|jgi:endoglucanase|nr:glycoside hydrolase family 6 protein [Solirubrobacteraceae bacterium]